MYSWVSDGSVRKYDRAVAQLIKDNNLKKQLNQPLVPITEEAIKALYVKWEGLLIGEEAAEVEVEVAPENVPPPEAPKEPKTAKKVK